MSRTCLKRGYSSEIEGVCIRGIASKNLPANIKSFFWGSSVKGRSRTAHRGALSGTSGLWVSRPSRKDGRGVRSRLQPLLTLGLRRWF
ncbi:hypothetical protein MnTg02_00231 [bacterium MnTg02]|nr:hypothetical protein MnTg02_00231 [bacterium MnTg02]